MLQEFNPFFFEEPVPPENVDEMARVAAAINIPVATGERLYTRWAFRELLEKQAADYIQPDLCHCGGFLEGYKIATMAEAYYVLISLHDASGLINVLAGAHVMASVPNHYRVETTRANLNAYDAYIDHPLDIRGDKIYLSDRPGLGIELDKDYMRGHVAEGYGG